MKTYILSVNTLTWNLTSERHDNCAPCLGLILPIRWVTPPPNFLVWSVSLMVLLLNIFAYWFVFNFQLIFMIYFTMLSWLISHIYIYMSSTTCTYSYVFIVESFELSECDRTLTSLCFLSQIYLSKSYAFYWNCRMSSLHPCQQKRQRQTLSSIEMIYLYCLYPEKPAQLSDMPGGRGNVGQLWVCCMLATCPTDVNRQGHLRNCAVPHTYL